MNNLYIALLHYPVYDRNGDIVNSAVTNLDIHDIARVARTYLLQGCFIVNPDREQRAIAAKICSHWLEGYGSEYNYERGSALNLIKVVAALAEACGMIAERHGVAPLTICTSAEVKEVFRDKTITFGEARESLNSQDRPHMLLMGTGWGLTETVLKEADKILEPVAGNGEYNHLSVRAAAAIIVDRLFNNL